MWFLQYVLGLCLQPLSALFVVVETPLRNLHLGVPGTAAQSNPWRSFVNWCDRNRDTTIVSAHLLASVFPLHVLLPQVETFTNNALPLTMSRVIPQYLALGAENDEGWSPSDMLKLDWTFLRVNMVLLE